MPGTRIAVLGLYNSGSTTLAGMLHRLGVSMGAPFWRSSDDASPHNYYEPIDLSWHLRGWWNEPELVEQRPAEQRIRVLEAWIRLQECVADGPAGAKHPLLSLCGPDLLRAWGPGTRFIWSHRPLQESVDGLARRAWFPGLETHLQGTLWEALQAFSADHPVARVDWHRVKADPAAAARELAALAGLAPDPASLEVAAAFVRRDP